MTNLRREDLPSYLELIYPTLKAVEKLGGSAQAREITAQIIADIDATEEELSLSYPNRDKSVLVDRIGWARSYATSGGALERPRRGLFVLGPAGRAILALPENDGLAKVRELDREVRARKAVASKAKPDQIPQEADQDAEDEVDAQLKSALLNRLHRLTPAAFEEFVIYVLKTFGMELKKVGGSGDEGIDGIGLAPIGPVMFTRVAVQAKRYDPTSALGREVVALFQRDAGAAGAERAVLVTLGRFTAAAVNAANTQRPTVTLVDGDRLFDLVKQQEIGIQPTVVDKWFDRFESS